MKYKYILFDLDGTLTDPKIGITKSVQHSLNKFSIQEKDLNNLEKFIGPPLKDSFMQFYNFNEEQANLAIEYYREYFKDTGIFENKPYSGIKHVLKLLVEKGHIVAVATSKPTVFAKQILQHFDMSKYFKIIVGSNLDGSRANKAEIIDYTLKQLSVSDLNSVLMIGDRKYDIVGAHSHKIDSIAVSYGYGSISELQEAKPTYIAHTVLDITNIIV